MLLKIYAFLSIVWYTDDDVKSDICVSNFSILSDIVKPESSLLLFLSSF